MMKLLFERIAGGHMLVGFRGTVTKRLQPGIYVPNGLIDVFKPKSEIEPATPVFVKMLDDPSKTFSGRVARVNSQQHIIHIPKGNLDVFVPGVECIVTLTDCDDDLVCRTSGGDERP